MTSPPPEPPSTPATPGPADPGPAGPPAAVAPGPQPRRFREWPIALVVCGVLLSLAVVALNHFLKGTLMLAGSVLLAALLRLVLPTRRAGLLAVRGRLADVLILVVLGIGLAALAWKGPHPS
jgi:Protein of unknown function (DUF3017)